MGVAIADSLAKRGANVILILGPSKLSPNHSNIKLSKVSTAQEMYNEAIRNFEDTDIAILAAAVSDYRPKEIALQKIKKKSAGMEIELEKTPDIAAALGALKSKDQIIIGFALETNNELENAHEKLERKNFDFIVLNSLKDKGAGFNFDTNKITILYRSNKKQEFELKSKVEVAEDIVTELIKFQHHKERKESIKSLT
jgi:phosphopantothenoylcysteine decarboxylase/phosphopantothenate--cysteine ligase